MSGNVPLDTRVQQKFRSACVFLRMRAIRSEYSLGAIWIAKDETFLYADNEDSDQNGQLRTC